MARPKFYHEVKIMVGKDIGILLINYHFHCYKSPFTVNLFNSIILENYQKSSLEGEDISLIALLQHPWD